MILDLLHNKIIKDTITDKFTVSFTENLISRLAERYGTSLVAVQMYEDYLKDNFVENGYFYYPLTVVVEDSVVRKWIRWSILPKSAFEGGVPYAYKGEEKLNIEFTEYVPEGFEEKLLKRGVYYEGGYVAFKLQSVSPDKTFLAGKYSQTFIDEMVRRISEAIERTFSVKGIAESGIELMMVFAPETYMEHVVGNVTYRRLLITARGCSARDLWIKWTHNNSTVPLTVSDNVDSSDVTFEIGEDVPQKIREKEYRFLVRSSSDKYQSAMGRKNITEWRDLIKRVIKRGELVRVAAEMPIPEKSELSFKLSEVLSGASEPKDEILEPVAVPAAAAVAEPTVEDVNSAYIDSLLKNALGVTAADSEAEEIEVQDNDVAELLSGILVAEASGDENESSEKEVLPTFSMPELEISAEAEKTVKEPASEYSEPEIPVVSTDDIFRLREEELRRKIEEELRQKLELEAQRKAEIEAEELRREHERLRAENERLAELARRAEEERMAKQEEIEARRRAEEREKARLAEAARLAVLEHQKMAAERALEERRRAEEQEALRREEEERRRAEEQAREAKRLEEERIRAEMAAKAEAEAKAKAEVVARAKAEAEAQKPRYTYVSKTARLIFRNSVDRNITKRIHEIILSVIKYYNKESVYMKIKATVPDPNTVNLEFQKFPEEETELLINIIKVLGKSGIGISKVFLE